MDSGRFMISSAAPFAAAGGGGGGGQVLLFGGGFGGGTPAAAAAAAAGTEGGRRKRPFQVVAHEEELRRLQLELAGDDVDVDVEQLYELRGAAAERGKRRLTAEQVRALEVSFEEERRKLEPEKKSELARRLGMAPRQVAVWFQNRRARWRAKQLEEDFGRLRAAHDELLAGRDALLADNRRLRSQVTSLTEKLQAKVSPAPSPEPSPEQEKTAATAAAAMRAAVYVELIQEDQLCTETTGGAVPATMSSFAAGGGAASSNDSLESYFAGAPSSPPSSSEGDCGDEGCAAFLPDAMLAAAMEEHSRGHVVEDDDSWEWFWN
ncbi:hypothetical protein ACP4OV_024088 [Aristida adscensionis]